MGGPIIPGWAMGIYLAFPPIILVVLSQISHAPGILSISLVGLLGIAYLASAFLLSIDANVAPRNRLWRIAAIVLMSVPCTFALFYELTSRLTDCIAPSEGLLDHIYFSYVAFTTVGFGDLSPKGFCRAISAFEAVSGYIALGLLVSASIQVFGKRMFSEPKD